MFVDNENKLEAKSTEFRPSVSLSSLKQSEKSIEGKIAPERSDSFEMNSLNPFQNLEVNKENYFSALTEIQELKNHIKSLETALVKSLSEEELQKKLNLALKENKDLKDNLIIHGKRVAVLEKSLKDLKKSQKELESDKSFLQTQMKSLSFKILSARTSVRTEIKLEDIYKEDFYLSLFTKIEKLSKSKTMTQVISPANSPKKLFDEGTVKINQSLQTDKDLGDFQKKYLKLKSWQDSVPKPKEPVDSPKSLKESFKTKEISIKELFKDLKELTSQSKSSNFQTLKQNSSSFKLFYSEKQKK